MADVYQPHKGISANVTIRTQVTYVECQFYFEIIEHRYRKNINGFLPNQKYVYKNYIILCKYLYCQVLISIVGTHCEIDTDPCVPSPCIHSGTCVLDSSLQLGYRCMCPDGFIGRPYVPLNFMSNVFYYNLTIYFKDLF